MPQASANNITMNYDQQGTGEPLILIPYPAADHACYAFQCQNARHFTCISVDLRGTGASDKPQGAYTTEQLADDVAAFMQACGIGKAHVSGLSLGGAIGLWLAAKHPDKVASLSLHSSWAKSDAYQRTIVESWQDLAKAVGVPEMIIRAIFPWCFTPELYAERPDYIESLAALSAAGRRSQCRTSSSSRMPFSLTTCRHTSGELPRRRRSPPAGCHLTRRGTSTQERHPQFGAPHLRGVREGAAV